MIQVIIGGILATFGGMTGIWFQAKNARRIRMDEIIAEKKIQANNEAYIRIKMIEGMLIQAGLEEVKEKIYEYDEWFLNTRLFLPGKFPDKWLSIKSNLINAIGLKKGSPDSAAELKRLDNFLVQLKDEAIEEIYKEMKLSNMQIEDSNKPESTKSSQIYAFIVFLALALSLFIFFGKIVNLSNTTYDYWQEILFCSGCAAIGVSLGLYTNRTAVHSPLRYVTYLPFLWFIASLSAFVALGTFPHDIIRSYAAAILAGVTVGFIGDKLPEKLFGFK
ncbi:MAG: hypothetical protein PHG31_03265 [Candidatus Omnitrophica bacterium]|nr:hypothetical protein [Candidatus Omnitrophota bacterium]